MAATTPIVPRCEATNPYCGRSPLVACEFGLDGRAGFDLACGVSIVGVNAYHGLIEASIRESRSV